MQNDRQLFTVTRWLLKAGVVVIPILIGFMLLGAIALAFAGPHLPLDKINRDYGVQFAPSEIVRLGEVGIAGAMTIFALVAFILRAMLQIVDSAIAGDPFVAQNADHLSRIGWLVVGVYAVEGILVSWFRWVTPIAAQGKMHHGFEFPFGGLFAVLLIFVLARIFRRGTEMRAELEGTV